jgi:trigger factor
MNVELDELSSVKKRLTIEVPSEEVEQETRGVVREFGRKAKIPGFRPGKTPASVIQGRFRKEIREEVRDNLIRKSFMKAAQERGFQPISDPALEEVQYEEGQPLSFKVTFEILPEFEVHGYREVEVRRPSTAVPPDEVERSLGELQAARVRHVVEEGRRAEEGDIVVADVEGTPQEGESFRREGMQIEVGAKNNLPAFNEQLLGVQQQDEKRFDVDYPDEYPGKELAGKRVTFALVVREVKRRELPDLDDDFAKDLGEFESLAELRARVEEDLQARKKHDAERKLRESLLDKVLLQNAIPLPESLTESEIRHRMEELVRGMMQQGLDPQKSDMDWEQIRKQQEEPARKAVHARLVLDAIAKVEELEVDRRTVDERIRIEAQRMGVTPENLREELNKGSGMQALKNQLLREQTLDYLTSVANIQSEE